VGFVHLPTLFDWQTPRWIPDTHRQAVRPKPKILYDPLWCHRSPVAPFINPSAWKPFLFETSAELDVFLLKSNEPLGMILCQMFNKEIAIWQ
jgi:hypothetical protein